MNKKIVLSMLILVLSLEVQANQKNDRKYINALYSGKEYSIALEESILFINNYPRSKYVDDFVEKIAKTYYLKKRLCYL